MVTTYDVRTPAGPRGRSRRGRDDGAARRLRDVLRCNVFDGRWPDGVLPGESELMLTYAARRATVREALALLRADGIIERLQGVGTYALRERYIARLAEMHGTSAEPEDRLMASADRPDVLVRGPVPAPDVVADRLGIAAGDTVLCVEYVGRVDGVVVGLATNYLAYPDADAVDDVPFRADFYSLLRDSGLEIGGSEWVLSATNADAHVAAQLEVAPGTAVMLGEETIWDHAGRVYDFAVCYTRTDRFVFSSTQWAVGGRGDRVPIATTTGPVGTTAGSVASGR